MHGCSCLEQQHILCGSLISVSSNLQGLDSEVGTKNLAYEPMKKLKQGGFKANRFIFGK